MNVNQTGHYIHGFQSATISVVFLWQKHHTVVKVGICENRRVEILPATLQIINLKREIPQYYSGASKENKKKRCFYWVVGRSGMTRKRQFCIFWSQIDTNLTKFAFLYTFQAKIWIISDVRWCLRNHFNTQDKIVGQKKTRTNGCPTTRSVWMFECEIGKDKLVKSQWRHRGSINPKYP